MTGNLDSLKKKIEGFHWDQGHYLVEADSVASQNYHQGRRDSYEDVLDMLEELVRVQDKE